MADELLFDSERQEKKAKKRKWLLPAIVLAAILVIVVVLALILRSQKEPVNKGGEDTLYPYTWQRQDDGSLLLEISHADAPDYRWTLTEPEALQIVEASQEAKEKNNTTRFTLKPRGEGRDTVTLKLLREQTTVPEPSSKEEAIEIGYEGPGPEDVLFELSLLVEFTEEDGKLVGTVLNSSGVRRQGSLSGGADSANPYRIYARDEGHVTAAVKIASLETDWTCEILSGEQSVTVEAVLYDYREVQLHLTGGETPGESELVFRSEAAGAELRLCTSLQTDGSLLITEHRAEYGEKAVESPADDEEADVAEATAIAGDTASTEEETEAEDGEPRQKKNDMP